VLIGPLELVFANFCDADGRLHAAAGSAAVIGRTGFQPAALVVHRSKTAKQMYRRSPAEDVIEAEVRELPPEEPIKPYIEDKR
jgi:hypothetical protein